MFPETYAFDKDATGDEITRTFLDHFETIYEKYKADIDSSELSLHKLITLASIVQYEAATSEDMQRIAGVFYNSSESRYAFTINGNGLLCFV